MFGINHVGKHGGPSGPLPAAWARPMTRISPFKSTRNNFDCSASQMGRDRSPIVRQFLQLFGEGDEASPPGVEGEFHQR
jgi:hypothetical protein